MAIDTVPPEPNLANIRKLLSTPRPIWRVFGWGGAATAALAVVAFISQTDAGYERLRLAFAHTVEPAQASAQTPSRPAETERLADQVRELAADRERLSARIALLERNLDSVTGSIKRQIEPPAPAHAAITTPPAPAAPATAPAAIAAAPPPAPVAVAPPPAPPSASATVAIAQPPAPLAAPTTPPVYALPEPPSGVPRLTLLATASVRETARSLPPKTPEAATPEEPPETAEGAAEPAAIPPVRVVSAMANEPLATPTPPAGAGFGVDLGGASNLEALRIHWATLKANYGPLLVGLRPLVALLPKHPNGAIYRLVVGPLPSADKATQFCAGFPVLPTGCHPAKFSGGQLAAR
jgi:hypothetical protein